MLTHYPSTVTVFQSTEYKNFVMINGNRPLNENKIKKIIAEIESGNDMLQYYPIQVRVVKEKLEILDGQHRYFISKKLKRPIHYIMVHEEKTIHDIARVNSNVEKWKNTDFINSYIISGNKNYDIIKSFKDQYNMGMGVTLSLLHHGTPGADHGGTNGLIDDFQNGVFLVKNQQKAIDFAETCKRFDFFKGWNSRGFLIAIQRIMKADLVSIDDVHASVSKHPELLVTNSTGKDYIHNIERIMNIGKSKRVIIA
jgi:hypothetical protein